VRFHRPAAARLKVKIKIQYRLHDTRHTVATKMAIAGMPEAKRRYLIRQVSENVVWRYTQLKAENCREDLECALAVDESKPESSNEVPEWSKYSKSPRIRNLR
jgi:hypothetical protein